MKFGISYIALIAATFACLVSAIDRYEKLKAAGDDNAITTEITALKPTVLTLENYKAAKASTEKDYNLENLLAFDKEWAEAKDAFEKFTAAKEDDSNKKELKTTYDKELKEAEEAFQKLGDKSADFAAKMKELKPTEPPVTPSKTPDETPFYQNPWYIGIAVVILVILVACIWALFFRKKAEDL